MYREQAREPQVNPFAAHVDAMVAAREEADAVFASAVADLNAALVPHRARARLVPRPTCYEVQVYADGRLPASTRFGVVFSSDAFRLTAIRSTSDEVTADNVRALLVASLRSNAADSIGHGLYVVTRPRE
jgi:hypothetical protein